MDVLPRASSLARSFAATCHVDIEANTHDDQEIPVLMPLDDFGNPLLHITDKDAVDYHVSKIDYFRRDYHVAASRLISLVQPGHHTQLSYLPTQAEAKVFHVHHGEGALIVSKQHSEEEDFPSEIFKINPDITPTVTVPPGHFFTLEAASWFHEPLVVSEIREVIPGARLHDASIAFSAGKIILDTTDGYVAVPEDFREGCFD